MSLEELPPNVFVDIMSRLTIGEGMRLRRVSRAMNEIMLSKCPALLDLNGLWSKMREDYKGSQKNERLILWSYKFRFTIAATVWYLFSPFFYLIVSLITAVYFFPLLLLIPCQVAPLWIIATFSIHNATIPKRGYYGVKYRESGMGDSISNIIWNICGAGPIFCLVHLLFALLQAITFVGLRNSKAHLQAALLVMWPFGLYVQRQKAPALVEQPKFREIVNSKMKRMLNLDNTLTIVVK